MWTTLARIAGENTTGSDPWWLAGQKWAMENGISDGTIATENITREQLVTMIWRYAKYIDMDVSEGDDTNILSYTDAFDVNEWAISAMQWACAVGIINGIDGALQPPGLRHPCSAGRYPVSFCGRSSRCRSRNVYRNLHVELR